MNVKKIIVSKISIVLTALLIPLFASSPAAAWSHANTRGGSTEAAGGAVHHTNAYGGGETHVAGEGTTGHTAEGGTAYHQEGSGETHATGAYGGTATHYQGVGTTGTNAYGQSAYHPEGSATTYTTAAGGTAYHSSAYYGATYPAYHPPTTVNVYGSSCYNCGGWNTAGAAAAGVIVGAAVASSVASANTAAATSAAYNAGVAAGVTYAMGGVYAVLPSGCYPGSVNGQNYYTCGGTWFKPSYGANGVYYRVVPTP
jgi:hypothetical protein